MKKESSKKLIPQGCFMGTEGEIPPGGWRGTEGEIPPGGWRWVQPTFRDFYRSTSGETFEFGFYLTSGGHYEIDILSMPEYGDRKTDYHNTHRLESNNGNEHRVCIGRDTAIRTLRKAKYWAAKWAEHTMAYITDGTEFPNN